MENANMYEDSDLQVTRVMSPTLHANSEDIGALMIQCECPLCHTGVVNPTTCSGCGKYGHEDCLGLEYFQMLPFCGECMCVIITDYAQRQDQAKREEWRKHYAGQLAYWKQSATQVLGATTAIGQSLGGVTAVMVGSALQLAKGAVAGASAVVRSSSVASGSNRQLEIENAVVQK